VPNPDANEGSGVTEPSEQSVQFIVRVHARGQRYASSPWPGSGASGLEGASWFWRGRSGARLGCASWQSRVDWRRRCG